MNIRYWHKVDRTHANFRFEQKTDVANSVLSKSMESRSVNIWHKRSLMKLPRITLELAESSSSQ